jgi:autotransporter-associated beta strand protein
VPLPTTEQVVLIDTSGAVTIQGDDADHVFKLFSNSFGFTYILDNAPAITLGQLKSLTINAGNGTDELDLILNTNSNPLPTGGLVYHADGEPAGSSGDSLVVQDLGANSATYVPSLLNPNNGTLFIDGTPLFFTSVEQALTILGMASLTMTTPGSQDKLVVSQAFVTGGAGPGNAIAGTSDNATFHPLVFTVVQSFTLDTATNDQTSANDTVTLDNSWQLPQGVTTYAIRTGGGNDTLVFDATNFKSLPSQSVIFDAGSGADQIVDNADGTFGLSDTAFTTVTGGTIQLVNMAGKQANLMGGPGSDTFSVINWSGTVTVGGGGGTYTLNLAMDGGTLNAVGSVTLAGDVSTTAAATPSVINGSLNLGTSAHTFTVAHSPAVNDLIINATLSGAGALVKAGPGTLLLAGPNSNIYTGGTFVVEGTLLLDKPTAVAVPAGSFAIGDNDADTAVVRWLASFQAVSATPSVFADGLLDLNNQSETINGLTLQGGAVVTGTGTLTLAGDVTTLAASQTATISGHVDLGAFTHTFTVASGSATPPDLLIPAVMSSGRSILFLTQPELVKAGAGILDLTGANTYPGRTTVNGGTLLIDNAQPNQIVTVNTGGTLGGNGTVGTIVPNGGTITPGSNGLGRFSTPNQIAFTSTSTYVVQLSHTLGFGTTQPISGTLIVTGPVNLANATLSVTLGNASNVGDQFTILNNLSGTPIVGTFNGLPQGAVFFVSAQRFQISYIGGPNFRNVVVTHLNSLSQFPGRQITATLLNGQTATLTGTPADPDPLDTFILDVNWGDGSPAQEFTFPPGTPAVSLQHTYQDVNLSHTLMEVFPVQLTWTDQHRDGSKSDTLHVTVFSGPSPRAVAGLYPKLLGRQVDFAGLADWSARLDGGVPQEEVVLGIEDSLEYRTAQMQALYQAFLGRSADAIGLHDAVSRLADGATWTQVRAAILGSSEYLQERGGGNNDGFLDAVYHDVLNRPVDPTGRAAWEQALGDGVSRGQVAAAILESPEYLQERVQSLSQQVQGQPADPAALLAWVSELAGGVPEQRVLAEIAGGGQPESPNQRFVAQIYLDLLRRPVDPAGLAAWTSLLDQGASRQQVALAIASSPEYRMEQVESVYESLLGRPADTTGLKSALAFLSAGNTPEDLRAVVAASPEYFQQRGGGSEAGFVTELLQDARQGPTDSAFPTALADGLANPASRVRLAEALFSSDVYRHGLLVDDYQRLLHHTADEAGLSIGLGALRSGTPEELVIADLLGSKEYFRHL